MADTSAALGKLRYRTEARALILAAPNEVASMVASAPTADTTPGGRYGFVLAFARSLGDLDRIAASAQAGLEPAAVFWVAYPKGTSKRYPGADINRDSCRERMGDLGFEGVSLVAIDEDWSAMRFKPVA